MDPIILLQEELEKEAVTTRKMLTRISLENFGWQPHPKSMTLKRLACHIAEFPEWISYAITTDGLNFQDNPYIPPTIKDSNGLIDFFEESLIKGRKALSKADDSIFTQKWILRNGNLVYSEDTKYEMIRMIHSQIIHHRAQLGVYLRMLNIPVPGSYGPSADEIE